MHVLIIPSWYPSGPGDVNGIFFQQQAQALQHSGVRTGVIAPVFRSLRGEPESVFTGGYGVRSFTDHNIPTYLYKSMYFFPRTALDRSRWLKAGQKLFSRYVREHGRPDIIHAHAVNYGGILAHEIHSGTGIPYVLTEHSSTYARKLIRDWQRPAMLRAAQQCACRIAVSQDFCRLLEREYNGLGWHYIPNILPAKFAESAATEKTPDNGFTFCSVAHLNYNKGYDILLPAFAEALKKHPQLKLKIGGTGLADAQLHALARTLGIQDSVTFLGKLQNGQVLALMRQSDAFVLASRHETFGVVFIEALSQGLPVVATRCGGPNSIVTPENGLLVPTENIGELAAALISIYENHRSYNPAVLRENCLNEYGEHSVVAQIKAQYRKVLDAAPNRRGE